MDTAKRVVVVVVEEEEYLYGMIPGSKRGRAFVALPHRLRPQCVSISLYGMIKTEVTMRLGDT